MNCKKCGKELPVGAGFCMDCGTQVEGFDQVMQDNYAQLGMDRCPKCGHIGVGVPGKIFTKKEIGIGLVLCVLLVGVGLIYLLAVYMKKKKPENRDRVCPKCGAVMVKNAAGTVTMGGAANTIKNTVSTPEFKGAVKGLTKAVKNAGKSLDI